MCSAFLSSAVPKIQWDSNPCCPYSYLALGNLYHNLFLPGQQNKNELEIEFNITLKCLSIGTPKTIFFPFILDGKLMDFGCSNI